MNANILILCNTIPKDNDINTRAIISRTIAYEVKFSFKQKMRICKRFIDKDDTLTDTQKISIWLMLKENVSLQNIENNEQYLSKDFAQELIQLYFEIYNTNEARSQLSPKTPLLTINPQIISQTKPNLPPSVKTNGETKKEKSKNKDSLQDDIIHLVKQSLDQ